MKIEHKFQDVELSVKIETLEDYHLPSVDFTINEQHFSITHLEKHELLVF